MRGQQAARALFRLAQLPVTVRQLLIACFEQTHGGCDCALTHQQESDHGKGRDDQRANADGGAGQFVAGALQARAGKKAGRSRKDRQCNESRPCRALGPIA